MLHVGDALSLGKKTLTCLLVELVNAQHFQCQDTAEWRWFAHLVDMPIRACADVGDDLIDANTRSLYEKVAALADFRGLGVLMSPACAWIQTTGQ